LVRIRLNQRRALWRSILLAVVATLSISVVAQADENRPDGDGATPVSPALNPLNYGKVCVGATYVDTFLVAIERAQVMPDEPGNNNRVFNDGATVTVSVLSDSSTEIATSVPDGTIVLPSNWEDLSQTPLGTMSTDTATIEVTLVPTGFGTAADVSTRASGTPRTGSGSINRDRVAKVNWTPVTGCPEVTINQASGQNDPAFTSPIHFTAVFSEPVVGFATGDVSLSGTAGATTAVVTQIAPNDGTTYDVAVSGMTGSGTVIASIPQSVATDAGGAPNLGSTSTDNTVDFIAGFPLDALSDVHAWVGLKNSDDQGTQFDVQAELLQNGTVVATGLTRCFTGVTRNPSLAKDVVIEWDSFSGVVFLPSDTIALRLSTRIGTNPDGTKCAGHNNAVGLRLYYDSTTRQSRFDWTLSGGSSTDQFLHSDGNACVNAPSTGVTTRYLDETAPTATSAKCKDSTSINFNGGNPWSEIGTWSRTLP
jgi:hypothetical protein